MEGFKDLFQGGMCNPNMQAQNSSNAFKAMMGTLNNSTQMHPIYGAITPEQNLQLMMQNFEGAWSQEKMNFQQVQMQNQIAMNQIWEQEKNKQGMIYQQQMLHNQMLEQQWQANQKNMTVQEWRTFFIQNDGLSNQHELLQKVV